MYVDYPLNLQRLLGTDSFSNNSLYCIIIFFRSIKVNVL